MMAGAAKAKGRSWVTIKNGRKGEKHVTLESSQTPKASSSSSSSQMKILCSLPPTLSYFHFSLFMQEPKNDSNNTRKPWYQRAMQVSSIWKIISKSSQIPPPNSNNSKLWKSATMPKPPQVPTPIPNKNKLRKCTSLKAATSFTRVCLCAPMYSYNEILRADAIPPRRSNSYPRSSSNSKPLQSAQEIRTHSARLSTDHGTRRNFFRGKSLNDDVLMRRFVVEEEAMMQRRRNQMEVIRRRNVMRRKKLGPSPLRRMVMAQDN